MKVRILKNVLVEIEKPNLGEVWDKQLCRWDILRIESIDTAGKFAHLITYEGDIYLHVPQDSFEILED